MQSQYFCLITYEAFSKLYDALGRKQANVIRFDEKLITECSRQIAVDGHMIGCGSTCTDLADKEYQCSKLGEAQVNQLMAYDVNTHVPLMPRNCEGASADKVSVRDFLGQVELQDMVRNSELTAMMRFWNGF